VRQFINIDDALLAGFEITWNQHLLSGISHFMSIAYTYGQDLDRDEALPEIAPLDFRYLLSGDFINDKLHTEIGFRHVLQQDRISNTYGETETPSFSIVDMKASYIALPKLNLGIGIQNIFDVAYYEHLNRSVRGKERAIYAPGRSFVLSLTLDLTN
jgi:iron complex outermembrane receptor protein